MSDFAFSETPPEPPRPPARSKAPWIFVAALVVGGLGAATWVYLQHREAVAPFAAPLPDAVAVGDAGTVVPTSLDEMNDEEASHVTPGDQDEIVRSRVAPLSASSELAGWLENDDLVRRFTAAVTNISDGGSPRPVLLFLAPKGPFTVLESDGRIVIDPASYARYDGVAHVLASFDPARAAAAYRALRPFARRAYAEIGPPGRVLDQTLAKAIQEVLDTPVIDDELELVEQQGALYAFARPELEHLSPPQKNLLRMGPANAKKIQAALRSWATALGLRVR